MDFCGFSRSLRLADKTIRPNRILQQVLILHRAHQGKASFTVPTCF